MRYRTSHSKLSGALRLARKAFMSSLAASLLALPLAPAASAQTAGGSTLSKPRLVSNAKKYRDMGLPAATGRSGSATLTARALLGKDGQTAVELTTGALDAAAPAPGQITKAQLKPLNSNGEPLYARNFSGLTAGGTFSTVVKDLRRGQQVQAQANVAGIDPNRADVVTVVETVKLRPGLVVSHLNAPARSVVNTSVNLTAVVREVNGDVGARANLVLYVDGREADRADGVWVDANGVVSAAFTQTFTTEGVKRLEVRAERVAPGDYDAADNAAAASVEIVSPQVKLSYYASASDRTTLTRYVSDYAYNYSDGSTVSRNASSYTTANDARAQDVTFYGWSYRSAIRFPIDVSVTELNDDAPAVSASFDGVEADYSYTSDWGSYSYTSAFAYRQDYETGYYLYVNSYLVRDPEYGYNTDITQFSYSRHAGDVTYHSASTYSYYYSYQGQAPYEYSYSYNYDYSGKSGAFVPFGSRYGLDVTLRGADGTALTAAPRMSFVPVETNFSSNFCWEYSYETTSGRNCYDDFYSFKSKDGVASENNETF